MYVCICHAITDRQICRVVDQGAQTLGEVQMQLPVGACCGRCVDNAQTVIDEHQQHQLGTCQLSVRSHVAESALA
jgi:bacterioferritin-associated ferredoxin